MAAQTALVLNTKSYAPRGKDSGIAKWTLLGDASFGGAPSHVTQNVRDPNKNGDYKVQYKLDVPKAATTSSACSCAGDMLDRGLIDTVATIPQGWTEAERDDFLKRYRSLVNSQEFEDSIKSLTGAW